MRPIDNSREVTGQKKRRVLVVEDDRETAEAGNSYDVDLALDGEGGLSCAIASVYVVMTVDRLLPHLDGLEIIGQLRKRGVGAPALILSALSEVDDRVRGLRPSGDDYRYPASRAARLVR